MATEVLLPQWGMGMSEGQIVAWYHEVGEHVDEDAPIAAVEAEKAEQDLLAPVSGTLLQILVTAETGPVPVRTLLAIIGAPDEIVSVHTPEPVRPAESVVVETTTAVVRSSERDGRQVTPVARRLAKELAVELDSIEGTGPGGRVTEDDVRRAASGTGPVPLGPVATHTVSLTGMRGAIAKRMQASLQTGAQLTLVRQVDVTALVEMQKALRSTAGITITDLLLRGVAIALMQHPRLNATLTSDVISLHPHVHLGVAVAVDEGLIVPVIRDADTKSVAQISQEARELAARARGGALTPAEVSGSTFTVTNLGALSIDSFTPIINPPEVAILGVGRVTESFTRSGESGLWRSMMTLSLTIDHRAVDGAPGAMFLMALASTLSDIDSLTADC
jgi:pyruvate dehydrogenase E2 component (dihydrolipoamide acetyltransferase)